MSAGAGGPESIERRTFMARLPVLGASLQALASAGCAGFHYAVGRELDDRIVVRSADLADRDYALVETARWDRPVYLHRADGGSFTAVLAECTHRRCQPEPAGDRLICPCHGSEFSHDGRVLAGPADRPLPRFEVTEDAGEITVWTRAGIG